MTRTFIETPMFTKKWFALGLTDDDLAELQRQLLNDPKYGNSIKGTNGLRKIRIPYGEHGKRGGARVLYVDVEIKEKIYLLNVYSKNEQTDLTPDERKAFSAIVKILKEE